MNFEKSLGARNETMTQDINSGLLYERLGVGREASPIQVEEAFVRLTEKYQPADGPITEEMCLLQEACNAMRSENTTAVAFGREAAAMAEKLETMKQQFTKNQPAD